MNVIVITALDATNKWHVGIVRELAARGHGIYIFSIDQEQHNICMFTDMGLEVHSINDLNENVVGKSDIILCCNNTISRVVFFQKYIFTYNFQGMFGQYLSEGADILFLANSVQYDGFKEDSVTIVAGMTEGNRAVPVSRKNDEKKQFLFIDSGHYPFGREGKNALAKLLLSICASFPDYFLKIKPRFLRYEKNCTHQNNVHLYDCINAQCGGMIPENMILLEEHKELGKLVEESSVILCMYSSVFYSLAQCEKGIIVIGNLPNCDSVDTNNAFTWKCAEMILSKSGCLVDYRDILNYLPNGLKCNPEFLKDYVPYLNGKDNCIKIAEVMEYCYDTFIKYGYFLKTVDTNVDSYMDALQLEPEGSWERLIRRRLRNLLLARAVWKRDAINHEILLDEYSNWCSRQVMKWSIGKKLEINELLSLSEKKINQIISQSWKYICGNPVRESYYVESLYCTDKHKLLTYSENDFGCRRTYYYYMGILSRDKQDYVSAEKYLSKYLKETVEVEFCEYLTDRDFFINSVKKDIFPFSQVKKNAKVAIYGAGNQGQKYKYQIESSGFCKLVGFFDRNADEIFEDDAPIWNINQISQIDFDYIVIAIEDDEVCLEVYEILEKCGVKSKKIVIG